MQVYHTRHLEQTDWVIILRHAQRVRALPRLRGSSGLSADCIGALSNPPPSTESIFPNLRIVGLHKPNVKITPLVRHLTNPKLTSISFLDAGNLGAATDTFGERCPIVTTVHTDTASSLICYWQNLRSVE